MVGKVKKTRKADLTRFPKRMDRRTVQQEITEKLREAIFTGIFQPGDRLVEADLCALLNVSRPSLREAMRSLHAERLIEIIPNRGPQVPILSWDSADEIYAVRALLEGEAAALCAELIDDDGMADLARALDDFRLAVEADEAGGRLDATTRFYAIILSRCGNRIIEELLSGLHARINFLRSRSMSLSGRSRESLAEMTAIFSAIEDRDRNAACAAARQHVQNAREAARMTFEDKEAGEKAEA